MTRPSPTPDRPIRARSKQCLGDGDQTLRFLVAGNLHRLGAIGLGPQVLPQPVLLCDVLQGHVLTALQSPEELTRGCLPQVVGEELGDVAVAGAG
jgi:hypothetical protein